MPKRWKVEPAAKLAESIIIVTEVTADVFAHLVAEAIVPGSAPFVTLALTNEVLCLSVAE